MKPSGFNVPITRYGGIVPIVREMMKRKFPQLVDSYLDELSPRAKQSRYKYSDMVVTWVLSAMCGAKRIDHVTLLKEDLDLMPGFKVPSHDTIGYTMKKLTSEVQMEERKMNSQTNENFYDDNIALNRLLIQATKLMGGLDNSQEYILDVDCTFINTRCQDALSMKDKDQLGFYPMICLIGDFPVFVSMRNGNSIADFRIMECVEQCLQLLDEAGIKIKTVRTDGAGYRREYLNMLSNRSTKFITASPVNKSFKGMMSQFSNSAWRKVKIETANTIKDCEISEINYIMHGETNPIRIISLKIPIEAKLVAEMNLEDFQHYVKIQQKMQEHAKNKKLKSKNKRYQSADWNVIGEYKYRMFATNDWTTPPEDLVCLYNNRGTSEQKFNFMKNDFGWRLPPFIHMNENTVFMIISALANNVFRSILKIVEGKIPNVDLTIRVDKFRKIFINVIAIFVEHEWEFRSKINFEKIC